MAAGDLRKNIRAKIKELLDAVEDYPGDVQVGKHYLPAVEELPLTRIRTFVTEREKGSADDLDLLIDLEVEQWAAESASVSVDDALDEMADMAEAAVMATPETLDGLVFRVIPGSQGMAVDDSSENVLGAMVSTYTLHVINQ